MLDFRGRRLFLKRAFSLFELLGGAPKTPIMQGLSPAGNVLLLWRKEKDEKKHPPHPRPSPIWEGCN